MAELSLHGDGRTTIDSLLLPFVGSPACASAAEVELRSLFHQLSARFFPRDLASELFLLGPEAERSDHPELFVRWVQRIHAKAAADDQKEEDENGGVNASGRWLPFYPDLRRRIKRLVRMLLAEKSSASEKPAFSVSNAGKSQSHLNILLMRLKNVAAGPCNSAGVDREWKGQILRTRNALFLREEKISISDMEEFPYRRKKRRMCPRESSQGTENEMLNHPKRRSQRTLGLLKIDDCHLPRKRIPVGSSFQADVPNWTGPLIINKQCSDDKEDIDDLKWLGTHVWPAKWGGKETNEGNIGTGRKGFCHCTFPGSVECIIIHVNSARFQLRSELGSAFHDWGFDEMGEEVSKSWTSEEQANFGDIVRLNPLSEGKSFLEPASKSFTSKSKKDIVSYYFNVYVLKRMSNQTRVLSETIDSDDDEDNSKAYSLERYVYVPVPEVSYSISSQSRCIGWTS